MRQIDFPMRLFSILLLSLAGCTASTDRFTKDGRFVEEAESATLIIGVKHPEDWESFSLLFRNISGGDSFQFNPKRYCYNEWEAAFTLSVYKEIDSNFTCQEDPVRLGYYFFNVDPGTYETELYSIDLLRINQRTIEMSNKDIRRFNAQFSVNADEKLYIGDILFEEASIVLKLLGGIHRVTNISESFATAKPYFQRVLGAGADIRFRFMGLRDPEGTPLAPPAKTSPDTASEASLGVFLGAYNTEAEAQRAFETIATKHPNAVEGLKRTVQPASPKEGGNYNLFIYFVERIEGEQLCAAVRASAAGCAVVSAQK